VAAPIAVLVGGMAGGIVEIACEKETPPPPPTRSVAASVPLYVPPPPEGCARTGSLEGVESDPTCVVARSDETTPRETFKSLSFELVPDSPHVVAGAASTLRLTITNRAASEVVLLLEATPTTSGPRPDWTRLAGVPEPKPAPSGVTPIDVYRLAMPLRTLDSQQHGVDGLPSTAGGAAPVPRLLRVRLRPGGKLTHVFTWWALRIPAPGPITRDDAGHRYVPKTIAIPLPSGEYTVDVDLPIHGSQPPESTVGARIVVDKVEGRPTVPGRTSVPHP